MPRNTSKRLMSTIDDLTTSPPDAPLPPSQVIARISHAQGKNLFICTLPGDAAQAPLLAELAPIFRGKAWLRRGGYVLVDTAAFEGRDNKIDGQVVNVVRNERDWRKMPYWCAPPPTRAHAPPSLTPHRPAEFKGTGWAESSDEEDSVVGKMPPNSDDEEY